MGRFYATGLSRAQRGVPRAVISLGWFSGSWQSTYQRENTIAHNRIRNWLGVLADSGATYTLGPHLNSSLHHNYASHAGEVGLLSRSGPTGPSGSGIEPVAPPHLRFHGNGFYPDDGVRPPNFPSSCLESAHSEACRARSGTYITMLLKTFTAGSGCSPGTLTTNTTLPSTT